MYLKVNFDGCCCCCYILSCNCFFGFFQDDGSQVSIFALSGNNAQDGHLAAGRNGVKRLRTVSSRYLITLRGVGLICTNKRFSRAL